MSTGSGGFQMGGDLGARVNKELPSLEGVIADRVSDATIELFRIRTTPGYQIPFILNSFSSQSEVSLNAQEGKVDSNEIKVKVNIGEHRLLEVAEGNGPVHAFDCALRKTLQGSYPEIKDISLCGYKVIIEDPENHTAATTSVEIQAEFDGKKWFSVGRSTDIVKASAYALVDLYELFLHTQKSNH